MLRHAATPWGEQGRIEGQANLPLSPAAREAVLAWRLPAGARDLLWYASPCQAAVETAAQLGLTVRRESRLIEMNWGTWEGQSRAQLRLSGILGASDDEQGLDFRPPEGESPREVMVRLFSWLQDVARDGDGVGMITHKCVIRCLVALSLGWDLTGPPPFRPRPGRVHLFLVDAEGHPALAEADIPLR